MAPRLIYACGAIIAVAMVAVARIDPRVAPHAFYACIALAGVAYLTVVWLLPRSRLQSRWALALCLGLAALWRLPLLLSPPILSSDVYRYVWDGRLQQRGYDPYSISPDDPSVASLHDGETERLNHPSLPTLYPPVAELFFRLATHWSSSVRAMKVALVLCDGLIVIVLLRWLHGTGRDPYRVLSYAWNPLVALEVAGSGHVDVLGVLLLVLSAWCLTERRRFLATGAWMLAIGVKFLPIVLAPLYWRRVRSRDAVLAALVLVGFYVPFVSHGTLPIGSLGTYVDYWRFNAPLLAVGAMVVPARVVATIGVAIAVGLAARLRQICSVDSPAAWSWPLAALLVAAPAVYPWYALWFTPFLTETATWPLAVWTVSILLTYVDLIAGLPYWVIALEYGLVVAAAVPLVVRAMRRPIEA
jgi:hypothetical protein